LWRVDLHSQTPADWKMELFFDAYTGQAANAGQPIASAARRRSAGRPAVAAFRKWLLEQAVKA